ncbi:uncharacterized protein LOC110466519 isoform X1 [Mizuhopecten yessoensis]|uniref:uncharacterized protein LOC110466519 isoform X1 n=1 Tax=Mizuhopecten yessoensis TaxID=6573 RepID=UPI000B45B820|nr:uncharacterized protein LOC110466519 isoform X1 [Mizuhopecten yessoensis]XP_021378736.1 uncharacterized protein LOC110466519 isoform X1 [Mizuhopecten yessoensis]
MNMDLSWSPHLKVDAPTIVKNLRNEVKKHMEFISSNMSKFDNVNFALNEGQTMLRGILCRNCRDAVKSKRLELHSKNEKTHKKKNLKKLSQERQQIVNEITNNFIQLERSQNEDEGDEEYCTEEEYYRQELLEMESMYTNKLFDKQDEMREIEKKCKKEVKDKEAELRKVTIERDDYKKRNDSMSIKLKSFDKTESELRELKKEHKQLKENLDRMEYNIRKLKRELEIKEEDNERYRSSFQRYRKGSSAGADSSDRETQKSRRDNENLKLEHTKLLKQVGELQDKNSSLQEKLDSRDEELQRSRRDNENLKLEQIELIGSVQDENRSLKEKLERKVDELHSMKSQLEVLQKAKRKQIAMGLWKERSGMGKTMVDMITKELMRSVGGQLGRDNIDLTIRPCKTTSDISGSPLLVLCLNMSRIGTNIQDAIEGIQADKTNVFVLVLHHTSMDNLSSLTPTSLRVTGSELRKLGGIIDMAFSSDSGLYECDLNNNAAEKITSIMRKYMTA